MPTCDVKHGVGHEERVAMRTGAFRVCEEKKMSTGILTLIFYYTAVAHQSLTLRLLILVRSEVGIA